MKIFITGGTGFIGSHFINQAHLHGHDIVAQKRINSYSKIPLLKEPNWIIKDLDGDFRPVLQNCDIFIHFAAHTANPPYANLNDCLYWNVIASVRLLKQAIDIGIKNFIIAGSSFEYGASAIDQEFVHPSTKLAPSLSYPVSKACASISFIELAREYKINMKILRLFQVYGEGESPFRFWPSLCKAALEGNDFPMSSGNQIRDFILVNDVVQQFINELDFRNSVNGRTQIRNIGTGIGQKLIDFAEYWWINLNAKGKLLPGNIPLRDGEIERLVANIKDIHFI
jgi:nucleoside-diphosphate-sugar epimerase